MFERYLANENFPCKIVQYLRFSNDDVLYAAEVLNGASDEIILATALEQDRILLTFDRDFGKLVFHQRKLTVAGIVLFRLKQQSSDVILTFLKSFFDAKPSLRGFFTVTSSGHFRQVPLKTS